MIGSLMSRMADAEKLSVAQLNQAVKNGTIPAYVGVPLIQEKLKAEQAAKAMVAQTQAQPPLARQVMEQADMMSGLEKLQSNLPEEGYAGGGIVAFAEGGVSLPDEDEDEEKNLMSRLMAGITSLKSAMPESYEAMLAQKGQTPATVRKMMMEGPKKGDYVMPPLDSQRPSGSGRGHKYEDVVIKEAQRIGLDPSLAVHVLYKETGNLKNPESARSKAGAIGVMQLMPRTAKELGVDPLNPEENIRGGVMYLKQMYDKYQDPTLAFAAYNAGPGRVDKALRSGQGITSLPRETQNYVRMAGGGIVAFQNRGLVGSSMPEIDFEAIDSSTGMPYKSVSPLDVGRFAREGKSIEEYYKEKPVEKKPEFKTAPVSMTSPTYAELGYTPPKEEPAAAAAPEPYKEPPADQSLSDIKSLLKQRMEESGKQKRIDAYMSLLQAGLGMMGGTSPYAAANIGQGAAQGVAAQMAARRSQVSDENAILTGQLGLSRAELYDKMRRDALRQKAEEAGSLAEYRKGQIRAREQGALAQQSKNYLTAQKQFVDQGGRTDLQKEFTDKYGKNWKVDPRLQFSYNQMERQRIRDLMTIGSGED
jgi:hypothetical protein